MGQNLHNLQDLINVTKFIKSERLNKLAKGISSGLSHGLTGYLNGYERKMRTLVRDLDLKSRDARVRSREQLDRFTQQIRTTRGELEKKVLTVVNQEADRLNKGFNELVGYLKTLSTQEEIAASGQSAVHATKSPRPRRAKGPAKPRASAKSSSTLVARPKKAGPRPRKRPAAAPSQISFTE